MHRLFVAVDLPDDVRRSVAGLCKGVSGARWVPEEQLHLTLKFLGEVDDPTLSAVKRQLALVKLPSFSMMLTGVGHFPPGKNPRVLWVGIAENRELMALHGQVDRLLEDAAVPPDDRRFSPHITLARFREPAAAPVKNFEDRHQAFAAGPFPVTEFHLYESTLTTKGAIHTRAATYFLH